MVMRTITDGTVSTSCLLGPHIRAIRRVELPHSQGKDDADLGFFPDGR